MCCLTLGRKNLILLYSAINDNRRRVNRGRKRNLVLSMLWDTRHYFFWLMAISLFCWLLERLLPWREDQKVWRDQFAQDLFWVVFNGHYAGLLVATGAGWVLQQGAQGASLDGLGGG